MTERAADYGLDVVLEPRAEPLVCPEGLCTEPNAPFLCEWEKAITTMVAYHDPWALLAMRPDGDVRVFDASIEGIASCAKWGVRVRMMFPKREKVDPPWEPKPGTYWRDAEDDIWLVDEDGRLSCVGRGSLLSSLDPHTVQANYGPMVELAPRGSVDVDVDALCELQHNAYEQAALREGWATQEQSRKPWADVPEANKATMRATMQALLGELGLL